MDMGTARGTAFASWTVRSADRLDSPLAGRSISGGEGEPHVHAYVHVAQLPAQQLLRLAYAITQRVAMQPELGGGRIELAVMIQPDPKGVAQVDAAGVAVGVQRRQHRLGERGGRRRIGQLDGARRGQLVEVDHLSVARGGRGEGVLCLPYAIGEPVPRHLAAAPETYAVDPTGRRLHTGQLSPL